MSGALQLVERLLCVESWLDTFTSHTPITWFARQLELITGVSYPTLMSDPVDMVILFDEGQDSYWDLHLWNEFLKALEPGVGPIVIMFASFGSDGRSPVGLNTVTPLTLHRRQRICLASDPASGGFCLLMNDQEAMDLIGRRLAAICANSVVLDEELSRYLIIISDGHCGALSSLVLELCMV